MAEPLRFAIRVKTGARRTAVGGTLADPGGEDALVVAVTAPAVEGKANDAVRKAVATALGVRPRQVAIVRGERSRNKLIELDPTPDDAAQRLTRLQNDRELIEGANRSRS